MQLELIRSYEETGTNGSLYSEGALVCHTIELPWINNEHGRSCISEGRYEIRARYNEKFGSHFMVLNVPGRDAILIHPANDALKELRGCIAPVTQLSGPGQGTESRKALEALRQILNDKLQKETVFITINLEL